MGQSCVGILINIAWITAFSAASSPAVPTGMRSTAQYAAGVKL